jgi:formylglycine-generating enzyme required for sulfatase activity
MAEYGWNHRNAHGSHAVGAKKPNAWGVYDMHGNVWEWCADWYADYSPEEATDPTGPREGTVRVLRGGQWGERPEYCASTMRGGFDADTRNGSFGFRVFLALPAGE